LGKIWDGLGFPGGHLRGFIDQGVVDIDSSPAAMAQMRRWMCMCYGRESLRKICQ
jgi:hypothetical protein